MILLSPLLLRSRFEKPTLQELYPQLFEVNKKVLDGAVLGIRSTFCIYNLQPTTYNLQPTTYNLQPSSKLELQDDLSY
ncbi:MAG: hypothetical protein QNJ74_00330 [Trichodesmium sp. MO_231.B1]|nr:hypothetical protein [Trichodesmium sp. MO_231.B1]